MNNPLLIFPGGIGFGEILVVLLIVLVLFGAKKVPELMRGLGSGIKEFKKAAGDDDKTPPEKNNQEKDNSDK